MAHKSSFNPNNNSNPRSLRNPIIIQAIQISMKHSNQGIEAVNKWFLAKRRKVFKRTKSDSVLLPKV